VLSLYRNQMLLRTLNKPTGAERFMNVRQKIVWAAVLAMGLAANAGTAQDLKPGVVVEKVTNNSEAEKAGLREGDVLLTWVRGDAKGELTSPFDLSQIETEQAPRGIVAIDGLRGAEKQTWILGPSRWGISAWPNFPQTLLASYRKGQQSADVGKLKDAADKWEQMAKQIDRSQPAWLTWLLFHTAEAWAGAKRWKESDDSYQTVIGQSAGASPTIKAQLLRAWADTYQQRNDWDHAEEHYTQAVTEDQRLGAESFAIAVDLQNLGNLARERGDLIHAEEYYKRALAIAEKLAPLSLNLARTLDNLGIVVSLHGDLDNAEQYYRQGLGIQEKLAPGSLDVAASLHGLGNIALSRGDLVKAEEFYRESLNIKNRIVPGSLDTAATLNNLGRVMWVRGDLDKALEYLHQALDIEKEAAPGGMEIASVFLDIGNVFWLRRDLVNAERYYRQALDIYEKLSPGSMHVAGSFNSLGTTAWSRGDLDKAEEYFHQALSIYQKLAPHSLYVAGILNNLGEVVWERGDLEKAEEYQQQALSIRKKLAPGSMDVAESLTNLGNIARRRREFDEAEQYQHQALEIKEKVAPDSLDVANSLNDLGAVMQDRDNLEAAERDYRRALAILEKQAFGSREHAESLAGLASIMRRKQQPDSATQLFEQSLNALESQTARLGGSEDERAGFRAQQQEYYNDYIDLLIAQKQPERAFQILERSRARTLLETLAAAHVDIRKSADASLLERERELQQSYKTKSDRRAQLLSGQHTEEQAAAIEREIASLLGQYEEVEGRIRASSPAYAALTQPQPMSAKEVQQQLLDPDTLLLEYSLGGAHSYLFAVGPSSISAYELPKQAEIETAARRVYNILVARSHPVPGETEVQRMLRADRLEAQYPEAAAVLRRMILDPVAPLLQGKRLLIVSDGILQYIPFAALPSPGTELDPVPLISDHQIVNLPSASVLQVLEGESAGRARPAKAVAVLADPVFSASDDRVKHKNMTAKMASAMRGRETETSDSLSQGLLLRSATDVGIADGDFPRLFFSRHEAESILKETPPGQSMKAVDFQASRATATGPELTQYRIIHFATHGLLDSEHPEFSGLVLSLVDKDGKPQNGFLQLTDIYNLNLPVDMVVLSACETGLGKQIKGEGLVGITRGFMYAGASRVLASLWKVDDAATAELMGRFYKGMFKDNLSPATALQRAQVEMAKQKRWRSPYYWAGFVLQGEW